MQSFPAVVIHGPRQTGKTSLAERTFPTAELVSLDAGSNAEMAETRPLDFLAAHPPPVILDEVQYAPALLRHLKAAIDAHRPASGLYVMTGSQSIALMESVSESLAGRAAVLPLLGLSGKEWRAAVQPAADPDWMQLLWRGTFPALWAAGEAAPSRDRWYQGYVATYVERDVRNMLGVGSLRDFERFIRACAARTAQTLNMADLARDVGVSPPTVRKWLAVLEASGLVRLLEPYHASLGKRIVKSPKLYVTDTGLAAFLLGFDGPAAVLKSRFAGPLFETHVIGQWLRWRDWRCPSAGLWYWRDRSGHEVDLLVERSGMLHAIECKLTAAPAPRDAGGIGRLRAMYGGMVAPQAWIACTASGVFDVGEGIGAAPGWTAWDPDRGPLPA